MERASGYLTRSTPAVEKAKQTLQQGKKLIAERQKHIKVTDRSEHRLATGVYATNATGVYATDE